jgi:hypothetical protein
MVVKPYCGLQSKEKFAKYRNGFLEKNCKNIYNTKSNKLSNLKKSVNNTNSSGNNKK